MRPQKYGIQLPDRQLVSAPVRSAEGQEYLSSMRCAANYAFANRQVLDGEDGEGVPARVAYFAARTGHGTGVRRAPQHCQARTPRRWTGVEKTVCVHRKGATRAFPPGHPMIPVRYRSIGQPVLVPGDMGRYSFVLVGTQGAMEQTWGTVCHGAGRMMSRARAKREKTFQDLEQRDGASAVL